MPVPPCIPWRSVWLPRALTVVALIVGLPLFLRSPPWCDITLYQMAARNLLHGGVHYRDLFDTNLPGFVWAITALDAVFGPSALVVRVVDLLVVLGVVVLIDRVAKWSGATLAARWWAIAGVAMFYPFTAEMSHAQRDTWMALPGLAAVALRVRRGMASDESTTPPLHRSFYEGLLWGAGVWMKPHLALMAIGVWLLTARRLAGDQPRPWRAAGIDLLGNLLGGFAAALPGVLWLVASGAWPDFLEIFLYWNPSYVQLAQLELEGRVEQAFDWFPPWSLGLIATVPLALVSVLDMAPWSNRAGAGSPGGAGWLGRRLSPLLWDRTAGTDARFARGVLSGLYLIWVAQALFIQRAFHYVHVPETLLMLGIWASHRWAWTPVVFLWLAITSGVWLASDYSPDVRGCLDGMKPSARERYIPRHLLTDTTRLRLWPVCWRLNMTDAERYALRDKLRLHPPHDASIGWEEIAEVADYLRARGARDGEVIAWFNSPHAVYMIMDVKPGIRFMHVYTAITIPPGPEGTPLIGRDQVMIELAAAGRAVPPGRVMYVISDLEWVAAVAADGPQSRAQLLGPPCNPPHDLMPARSPFLDKFPFNQPTVFRTRNGTGRYIVHRIVTWDDDK